MPIGSRRYRTGTMSARTIAATKRRLNRRYARLARARSGYGYNVKGGRNTIALRNARTGGLLGIEHKYLDVARSALALTAPTNAAGGEIAPDLGGVVGCLTAPGQGDSPSQREGNKIVVDSILLQGTVAVPVQNAQSTADVACEVLVALVMDTQTNGAQLNSEDVFANPAGSATSATQPLRNMSYTQRFRVLRMKKFRLQMPPLVNDTGITGGITQAGMHKNFKLSWKGKMPVTFTTSSTSADIANVTNNSIQVVAYCSNVNLAPTIQYNSRMRFYG